MIRKLLLIGTVLLFTPIVFADDSNNSDETLAIFKAPKSNQESNISNNYVSKYIDTEDHKSEDVNDFYIRISGGLESDISDCYIINYAFKSKYTASGFFGVITLGYGRKFWDNELYLGLAIDGTKNNASSSFPSNLYLTNYTGSITLPYSLGAFIVSGAYAGKMTLIYLKTGAAATKYKVSMPANNLINDTSFDKNVLGYSIGGGLDFFMNKNFSFNLEYLFNTYKSFTYQYNFMGGVYDGKFKPYSNQISVGLAYHFN